MWTWKARAWAGLATLGLLAGLATARWFPFLLGLCLAAALGYARLVLRPEEALAGEGSVSLDQIPEGEPLQVEARAENDSDDTVFLEVRDRLPRQVEVTAGSSSTAAALDPGETCSLDYEAKAHLFGVYEIGPLEARIEDPFGLVAEEQTPSVPSELVVVPAEAEIEDPRTRVTEFQTFQGEYTVNRPGDGFDFYGLREYADGDSYRDINWKASAKTGDIMVNQFELSTGSEITLLVDGRAITGIGPEDETPFVLASRGLAGLLEEFFDRRDSPRVAIYGDELELVHPGPPDRVVNESLEALASWEPAGQLSLSHHLQDVLPRVAPGTPVVLVSPLVADPTILESVTRMLARDIEVAAVAVPLPEMPEAPEEEIEALEADRLSTIEGLQGFEIDVHRPDRVARAQEVAP